MIKIFLSPFIVFAGLGLFSTLVLHISAIFRIPFEHYNKAFYLAIGVFVVWVPTVFVAKALTKDFKRKDFWKAAFRGCPLWLKIIAYICFGYAFFNFIYMIIAGPDEDAISTARLISGHILPFYSVALATLYSATRVSEIDNARRCKNGHAVSPSAKYCEECGNPVLEVENKL